MFIDKFAITKRLSLPKATDYIIIFHFASLNMGRGTQLTALKGGRILADKEENVSVPEITKRLKRSQKVIRSFLPGVINHRDARIASNQKNGLKQTKISSEQVQSHLNLSASRSTILRTINKFVLGTRN